MTFIPPPTPASKFVRATACRRADQRERLLILFAVVEGITLDEARARLASGQAVIVEGDYLDQAEL